MCGPHENRAMVPLQQENAMRYVLSFASTLAALIGLAPAGTAQESKAILDAPLVMWGPQDRVENLIDLNLDTRTDSLSWWYTSSSKTGIQVRGWINQPDDTFIQAWEILHSGALPAMETQLEVGDVDGDGKLDFAVEFRGSLAVYRSNGTAPPTLLQTLA